MLVDVRSGDPSKVRGAAAVVPLMRPRSVAIIGASTRPGAAGNNAFKNILAAGFAGQLHLVGRNGGKIDGHAILDDIEELPRGIDLAVLALPRAGVRDALAACASKSVKSAVIFAAGFSELGCDGQTEQDEISRIAAQSGLAILGPNCLGFSNFVDGLSISFFGATGRRAAPAQRTAEGFAVVGQSGLLVAHIRQAIEIRGPRSTYFVTTGNEAGLGIADFLDFFAHDDSTRTIVIFAEHVRRPADFLAATTSALEAGKRIVMLHTGKSEQAKATARSHTGAMAGDYAAMRVALEHAGVAMVDTLEEIVDVSELLIKFAAPTKGVGIVSFSGALCGQSHDYCAEIGLDIPPLSASVADALRPHISEFAPPSNPLDLTTQPAWRPELLGIGAKALLDDPAIGSVLLATPIEASRHPTDYLDGLLPRLEGNVKPIVYGAVTDGPVPANLAERLLETKLPLIPSPERALRAIAAVTKFGRRAARLNLAEPVRPLTEVPALSRGVLSEWRGKKVLEEIGISSPKGALARTLDEAHKIAARVAYPIVLKAQSASLTHKTDAGGVIVGIANPEELARAWAKMNTDVRASHPDIALEGMLVEELVSNAGTELMIGARRDPDWGPLLLAGLGGVWVEALGDVRLMPADLAPTEIVEELLMLKGARLLTGFRGTPLLDIEAAAQAASRLGQLMLAAPNIQDIEINPLIVHPRGQGALALDALIVVGGD